MRRVLIGCLVVFVSTVLPAQVQNAGIAMAQIYSLGQTQEQSNWCWLASTQLVLSYYGFHVSQADIAIHILGSTVNVGGSDDNIMKALTYDGPGSNGQPLHLRPTEFPGIPLPPVFIQELSNGRPIYIAYKDNSPANHSLVGHAIVITGVTWEPTQYGPRILSVVFHDPSPFAQGNTAGWIQLSDRSLDGFFNDIRSYWLIRPI